MLSSLLAGIAWATYRRGTLAWALAALLVAVFAYLGVGGPAVLYRPVNGVVPFLPFLCFLVMAWGVACRDRSLILPCVLVATFVVQSNLAFAVPTLAVGVASAILYSRRLHPVPSIPMHARSASKASLALGLMMASTVVALWAFPVGEALVNDGGNLLALWRAVRADYPVQGWASGRFAWIAISSPIHRWSSLGFGPDQLTSAPLWFGAAVGAALAMLLYRLRNSPVSAGRRLIVLTLACGVAAVLSASRLAVADGFSFVHLIWLLPVNAMVWLALMAGVSDLLPRLRSHVLGPVALVAAGSLVMSLIATPELRSPIARVAWPIVDMESNVWIHDAVRELGTQVRIHLDADGVYELVSSGGAHFRSLENGLFADLDLHGFDVVTDILTNYYGPGRSAEARRAEVDAILTISPADLAHPPSGAVLLTSYRPPGWDPLAVAALARDMAARVGDAEDVTLTTTTAGTSVDAVLFGRLPGVCLPELPISEDCVDQADHAPRNDLPDPLPHMALLDLYRNFMVATPALDEELAARGAAVYQAQGVDVWIQSPSEP